MVSGVSGKVAFITGGASGIGAALAAELVEQGAEVWIADRQIDDAQELARLLGEAGGQAHAIELDVRNFPDFERAVGEAMRHSGRIDYLFNNAAIGVAGEIDSYVLEDWYDVFDVNLRGVNYPGFCSYSVARAGVGWLAGCEVPVRAASYSAGLW